MSKSVRRWWPAASAVVFAWALALAGCSENDLVGGCKCGEGLVCVQGSCHLICDADRPCGTGEVCLDGACWQEVPGLGDAVGGDPAGGGDHASSSGDTSLAGGDSTPGGDDALTPGDGTCPGSETPVVAWPDRDHDGFTVESETICVDGTLPDTHLATAHPPPFMAFGAGLASETGSGRSWSSEAHARVPPEYTTSELEEGPSRQLVLTGFGLDLPGDALVRGVQVWITRRRREGTVRDHDIRLVVDGAATGDSRADTVTIWPYSMQTVDYGGPRDLWGTALTAAQVNAPGFGVSIRVTAPGDAKADISHVWLGVFTDAGIDCDDGAVGTYSTVSYLTDMDGDGFGVGAVSTACVGAEALPDHTASPATGIDCYDDNAGASPIETGWHATDRGDGSYDYDCNDVEEVRERTEDLTCEAGTTACTATRNTFVPATGCGNPNPINDCQGSIATTCELVAITVSTECR